MLLGTSCLDWIVMHPAKIDIQAALQAAKAAAIEAGKFIAQQQRAHSFQLNFKGENDFVTSADVEAEKLIIAELSKFSSSIGFLSEETNPQTKLKAGFQDPLWVIDPIDGTTNYAHGQTQCAVSIALFAEGKVQLGVVNAAMQGEHFWASLGGGAFCNGNQIHVQDISNLRRALVATGFSPIRSQLDRDMARFRAVLENCSDMRRAGAASLDACWVACGRLHAYYESTIKPWDIAAAGLIAREAGALTSHLTEPSAQELLPADLYPHEFIVAVPGILQPLCELLRKAGKAA